LTGNDITTIIAAVLALVTAVIGLLNNKRIGTVHSLVNTQHDDLVTRGDQLTKALTDANIAVPDKPEGNNAG
jgi:hypothetical protein